MKTTTITRFFPRSSAVLIHQSGTELTLPSKGVEVILHIRENESDPCTAEIVSGDHYAEIGLSFAGKELVDYDGVFFLPREIGEILRDSGYVVTEDCFA